MLEQLDVGLGDVPESRRVPSGLSFTVQGSATTNGCDRLVMFLRVEESLRGSRLLFRVPPQLTGATGNEPSVACNPPPLDAGNVGDSMVLGQSTSFSTMFPFLSSEDVCRRYA